MKALIITIGDEILLGQITDTNSTWIAGFLKDFGIYINEILSISDDEVAIKNALNNAVSQNIDLVFITGGLGPTKDDITKKCIAEFLNCNLVFSEKAYKSVENVFKTRGMEVTETNRLQAYIPEKSIALENKNGTAPGMYFKKDNTHFFSMPGVPFEMKALMETEIISVIKSKFKVNPAYIKTVLTFGMGESHLSDKIESWENKIKNEGMHLAYLPSPGRIRLRISLFNEDFSLAKKKVDNAIDELQLIIPDLVFGFDDDTMASVIGDLLIKENATIATAESCTGGNIAAMLTSIPGSSGYFKGSVIAYSNEIKQKLLGVQENTLMKHGAVSEQTVKQMATGVLKSFNTDYAVATSGIAGPGGGTEEKPVGLVWIAVASKDKVFAKKFLFGNNRERNMLRASYTALNMLRLHLTTKMNS